MSGNPFDRSAGTVVSVPSSNTGVRAIIAIDGFSGAQRAIITKVGYSQAVSAQLLHTLNNNVYLYSFGDRIGRLSLQGMTFLLPCDTTAVGPGLNYVMEWYWQKRVSKTGVHISVALAGNAIHGFLMNLAVNTVNTEYQLFSFEYEIYTLPTG